jgi:hypothetical protein
MGQTFANWQSFSRQFDFRLHRSVYLFLHSTIAGPTNSHGYLQYTWNLATPFAGHQPYHKK